MAFAAIPVRTNDQHTSYLAIPFLSPSLAYTIPQITILQPCLMLPLTHGTSSMACTNSETQVAYAAFNATLLSRSECAGIYILYFCCLENVITFRSSSKEGVSGTVTRWWSVVLIYAYMQYL